MLEEEYFKPDTVGTSEILRELSDRTGFTARELKNIFAVFYDILAEKVAQGGFTSITFDRAINLRVKKTPENIVKNDDGSITVTPEILDVQSFLGPKIKKAIIDLYNKEKELD